MTQQWCSTVTGGLRLAVQVMPNARKSEIAGIAENMLKIRLKAQPIEGKANEALLKYIADALDLPRSAVRLTHGHTGRRKLLTIEAPHLTVTAVQEKLL
jgi:uncharacterized protein